jgi:hypothetical protein
MKNSVKDIGEEFLSESQAIGLMVEGRHLWADHDFSMRERKHIGRGRVGKVGVVQTAAFAG